MTRKNLFFLVIAFIAGVSVWIFKVNQDLNQTQELIAEQVQRPQDSPTQVPAVEKPQTVDSNKEARARLLSQYQILQQQLIEEQAKLEQVQTSLQELQQQQTAQEPTTYSSQIRDVTVEIQDFIDELNAYDRLEVEMNRRANEILRDQNSQSQVLKDQIDEQIKAQEDLVRQTKEEIVFWRYNGSYVNEREARQQELQSQLEAQEQQLAALREQRLNTSADILTRERTLQAEKVQALSELEEARSGVREEINSLREQIYTLQVNQSQDRTSKMSLGSQIIQTQKDYEKQQERVRSISNSLLQKNEEINLIK